MSRDTEGEIEQERTTDTGRERATVFKSNTGVGVVEGTVARLTGGGKFVVQPISGEALVNVGDQVIIYILDKKLLERNALRGTQTTTHSTR